MKWWHAKESEEIIIEETTREVEICGKKLSPFWSSIIGPVAEVIGFIIYYTAYFDAPALWGRLAFEKGRAQRIF